MVYICEAHASDVWPLKYSFEQPAPTSLTQRAAYARRCANELSFAASGFKLLCDGMDDGFNAGFGSWPTSYYLVDHSGTLLHVGEATGEQYAYDVRSFIGEVRKAVREQEALGLCHQLAA